VELRTSVTQWLLGSVSLTGSQVPFDLMDEFDEIVAGERSRVHLSEDCSPNVIGSLNCMFPTDHAPIRQLGWKRRRLEALDSQPGSFPPAQ
jgi:hypothetical protein